MDIALVVGAAGMSVLLLAFVLNLFKKIMQDSVIYNALNIVGSGLLIYYAYVLNSTPFLILEITWALFAVYKLIIIFKK
jgi:threonine/homoserine/homoserine lactone efflux protein